MRETILACDIDGVIANFTDAFKQEAITLGYKFPDGWQPKDWNWSGALTKGEIDHVWKHVIEKPDFWLDLMGYPDNIESLQQIVYAQPYTPLFYTTIYYVTSRCKTAGLPLMEQTSRWLHGQGIMAERASLIIVPNHASKPDVINAIGANFFVDDKAETVQLAQKQCPNCVSYLLDRPWNQDAGGVIRMSGLHQLLFAMYQNGGMVV